MAADEHLNPTQFFHGTAADLKPGDRIENGKNHTGPWGEGLDEDPWATMNSSRAARCAIAAADAHSNLAGSPVPPRIYKVEPEGPVSAPFGKYDADRQAPSFKVIGEHPESEWWKGA